MIDIENIKLLTMANEPYEINNIIIQPKTLRDIIKYGYGNYNQKLSIVSARVDDLFQKEFVEQIPEETSLIELLVATNSFDFLDVYFDSIVYFTNIKKINHAIGADDIETIKQIVDIVKIQNCIVTKEDENFNPLNERAKKIKEKMLANKKKIQELKSSSNDEETLTILDLISILCSKNENGINLLNVFDMNMMQFNDQFNRMKINEEYEVNIHALLHGADMKEVKLKHWMTKI